jgi:aldehyde:ferredoxin oxidoreductase
VYAVSGKLLHVNLEDSGLQFEDIPEQVYREYLGGYGIGVSLLLERMDPGTDPLGPGNILGFATGYLTGTGAYISSRYMTFGKSPSTGGWGDANCGGYFGPKMKAAGVDVILFTGISNSPVYLMVDEGKAVLHDASSLWGKDCYETEDALKEIHGEDCEVACIGPSGEHLSALAGISTDKGRFAARSALGAVMGSKKVKAVVLKGGLPIELADPDKMKALRKEHLPAFKEEFGADLKKYGTPMFLEAALKDGDIPWKNWSSSVEEMPDYKITADGILQYQVKRYACAGCPVGCGGHLKVESGKYKTDTTVHKVEYETMGIFGPNLLIDDFEALITVNDLCNRFGLDTISCGGLVALAIECYERGIINDIQTQGLKLSWGDADAVIELVKRIGRAEGLGEVLSRGFDAAVEAFGPESAEYAMAVRNEGFPAHDPRWSAGLALTYFVDPTPARHTQGSTTFPLAGMDMPEFDAHVEGGRAPFHSENVNWTHVLNSAGLCLFGYNILDYKTLPDVLNAADGREWDLQELSRMGLRITLARQIFNIRAGWTLDRYRFPDRALGKPALSSGELKDVSVDLELLFNEYMNEMGWDTKTGLPTDEILNDLGLKRFLSNP